MSDDTPFYAPDHKAAPKPERPRELLWTMTDGFNVCRAELRPGLGERVELQVFVNGELRVAHLHPARSWAQMEADMKRQTLVYKDWTLVATAEGV